MSRGCWPPHSMNKQSNWSRSGASQADVDVSQETNKRHFPPPLPSSPPRHPPGCSFGRWVSRRWRPVFGDSAGLRCAAYLHEDGVHLCLITLSNIYFISFQEINDYEITMFSFHIRYTLHTENMRTTYEHLLILKHHILRYRMLRCQITALMASNCFSVLKRSWRILNACMFDDFENGWEYGVIMRPVNCSREQVFLGARPIQALFAPIQHARHDAGWKIADAAAENGLL